MKNRTLQSFQMFRERYIHGSLHGSKDDHTDSKTLLINHITEAKKTTNKLLKNI